MVQVYLNIFYCACLSKLHIVANIKFIGCDMCETWITDGWREQKKSQIVESKIYCEFGGQAHIKV